MEQNSQLLSGGSSLETFSVGEQRSQLSASSRRRRAAVVLISMVAAVACLATVSNVGQFDAPVAMEQGTQVQLSAASLTSTLPSWLRTSPVKLVPLAQMEREQMLTHEISKGRMNEKVKKEEMTDSHQASPHQLAMHNVKSPAKAAQLAHIKKAAVAKKAAHARLHAKQLAMNTKIGLDSGDAASTAGHGTSGSVEPVTIPAPVVANKATPSQLAGPGKKAVKAAAPVKSALAAARPAEAAAPVKSALAAARPVEVSLPEQLRFDKKELSAVDHGREEAQHAVKMAELHKMAFIKAEAGAQTAHILHDMALVEKEEVEVREEGQMVSEKAKLKAQMAAIEHQEDAKIAHVQASLYHAASQRGGSLVVPVSDAMESKAAPPSGPSAKVVRAHAPVQAAAVKVVHAEAAPAKRAKAAKVVAVHPVEKKAREMSLDMVAAKPVRVARTLHCQGKECVDGNAFTSAKFNVDKIASAAQLGDGSARMQALSRMKELQKQIEADSHQVIGFALHQEHQDPGTK